MKLAQEAHAEGLPQTQLETGEATGLSEITEEARKLVKGALKALSEIASNTRCKASERLKAAVDVLT